MSITFSVEGATYSPMKRPCEDCGGSGTRVYHGDADPCPYCDGVGSWVEHVCDLPEVNMSNSNAYAFIRGLGEEPDCCGHWDTAKLQTLFGRLTLLASGATAPMLEKATERSGGPGTGQCRIVEIGRDENYVIRRAGQLSGVVREALKRGVGVTWG